VKLFYIVPTEILPQANFGYHTLDLSNGKLLMAVEWTDELDEMRWANRQEVIPLPHPFLEQAVPLSDEHLAHLSFRFPVEKGDNVHVLLKHAMKHDSFMRVWAK
jgi:hypothetical protein